MGERIRFHETTFLEYDSLNGQQTLTNVTSITKSDHYDSTVFEQTNKEYLP